MKIIETFDEKTVAQIECKLFEIELDKMPQYNQLTVVLSGYGNMFTETYKIVYDHGKWIIVT